MTYVSQKSPFRLIGFIRAFTRLGNPFREHSDIEG